MGLFKKFVITSSIEINATVDEVWNFFQNIESNYVDWYPEEHIFFKWTKGNPNEIDSEFDSEEDVSGHKAKIKGKCIESIRNKTIVLKPAWPVSFMCPRLEWNFEQKDGTVVFNAITHYKFGRLFLAFKKKSAMEMMELSQKHMDVEGINLKKILEKN